MARYENHDADNELFAQCERSIDGILQLPSSRRHEALQLVRARVMHRLTDGTPAAEIIDRVYHDFRNKYIGLIDHDLSRRIVCYMTPRVIESLAR